jgi:hypothetical protein
MLESSQHFQPSHPAILVQTASPANIQLLEHQYVSAVMQGAIRQMARKRVQCVLVDHNRIQRGVHVMNVLQGNSEERAHNTWNADHVLQESTYLQQGVMPLGIVSNVQQESTLDW